MVTLDPVLCHVSNGYAKINGPTGCLVRFAVVFIPTRMGETFSKFEENGKDQKRRDLRFYSPYHG